MLKRIEEYQYVGTVTDHLDMAGLKELLESYDPPTRSEQLQVVASSSYTTLKPIAQGFLDELLPFSVSMDMINYMFKKYANMGDQMTDVVDEFTEDEKQ